MKAEDYTIEGCPFCDQDVAIRSHGITACPSCGKPLAPCSVCCLDYSGCMFPNPYPYGCTGGPEDEFKPITKTGYTITLAKLTMWTFNKMWRVVMPEEAREKIDSQRRAAGITEPRNLEEQAISLVGKDIYERFIKGYTEKQWGRPCKELPAFLIRRLPVRFTYDNNYLHALYQGIPVNGYTAMIAKMLDGVDVRLNCDFLEHRAEFKGIARRIVFTGQIDAWFSYELGMLEYRTLRFETEPLSDTSNYQGCAVMNYTDRKTPFTRCIEHKHFYPELETVSTVISYEYPSEWKAGDESYYPVNNERNTSLYESYKTLAQKRCPDVIFAGRLGEYKYYDMDTAMMRVFEIVSENLGRA